VLLTRADLRTRVVAAAVAGLALLVGVVGLVAHRAYREDSAPHASNIGVVTAAGPSPGPTAPTPTAPGDSLRTHSTELGAQGADGNAPADVTIPRLHVHAATSATGVAPDNRSLALPPSARTVVWWAYGARPGDPDGTVLLAGHVSWNGRVGALGALGALHVGDQVTVQRKDGQRVRYAVTGRRNVPKMSLDQLGLFATGGTPRLVLVTCGGRYDASRHSYEDNVVVQARPV
jgi:hypothetical protein